MTYVHLSPTVSPRIRLGNPCESARRRQPLPIQTAIHPATLSYEAAFPALKNVYVEDSYVLAIITLADSVEFDLDLVLTPDHPAYHAPGPDEQYCYRRARIVIESARAVRWVRQSMQRFRDATGEVDYGSIDSWRVDGDVSHLAGDWGELEVDGGNVRVVLDPDDEQETGETV